MRKGLLIALPALVASAGLAPAQYSYPQAGGYYPPQAGYYAAPTPAYPQPQAYANYPSSNGYYAAGYPANAQPQTGYVYPPQAGYYAANNQPQAYYPPQAAYAAPRPVAQPQPNPYYASQPGYYAAAPAQPPVVWNGQYYQQNPYYNQAAAQQRPVVAPPTYYYQPVAPPQMAAAPTPVVVVHSAAAPPAAPVNQVVLTNLKEGTPPRAAPPAADAKATATMTETLAAMGLAPRPDTDSDSLADAAGAAKSAPHQAITADDKCAAPCLTCDPCAKKSCPGPHLWARAEYLMWWLKGYDVPALVTTGPADLDGPGFLGNPGTVVLLGGDDLNHNSFFNGGRFSAGLFFDQANTLGIDGSYFFLGQQGGETTFGSGQYPVLSRPFFNVNLGTEFAQVVAFPGISTGTVSVTDFTRFQGADVNLIKSLCCGCKGCDRFQLNALAGFRYLDLDEGLGVREEIDVAPGAPLPDLAGRHITVTDSFGTRNQFYGGQLGLSGWAVWRNFLVDVRGQVALGSMVQTLDIQGNQVVSGGGLPPSFSLGGLLALPSNIGSHRDERFAVVPEVTVNVGYQFGQNLRAFVGYNFLFLSDVIRPGDQIDRNLNAAQIPNFGTFPSAPVVPLAQFNQSDFWAQGVNFGVQVQW